MTAHPDSTDPERLAVYQARVRAYLPKMQKAKLRGTIAEVLFYRMLWRDSGERSSVVPVAVIDSMTANLPAAKIPKAVQALVAFGFLTRASSDRPRHSIIPAVNHGSQ